MERQIIPDPWKPEQLTEAQKLHPNERTRANKLVTISLAAGLALGNTARAQERPKTENRPNPDHASEVNKPPTLKELKEIWAKRRNTPPPKHYHFEPDRPKPAPHLNNDKPKSPKEMPQKKQ